MGVLDVKNRIVLALLFDQRKVEIERRVVAPEQQHETGRIHTDFFHNISKCHQVTGPLAHFHRIAIPQQLDQLAEPHVGRSLAARYGFHCCFDALGITRMVGAQNVDQRGKAAQHLVAVIGDVGGKIGVAAIRFDERPVHVVAELGGAKQRLLAVFPVVGQLALRRVEPSLIDQALLAQPGQRLFDLAPWSVQGLFGKEHVVLDIEFFQIGLDQFKHCGQHMLLDRRQPRLFGLVQQGVAEFFHKRLPHRDQIVARIKAHWNFNRFTQRLAVAQESRAGQRIDLRSGIVDVIFLGHLVACVGQKRCQRVAINGAARMAHMHRTGRIGRNIFDIDLLALPHIGPSEIVAAFGNRREHLVPDTLLQPEIDEPRSGDLDRSHIGVARKPLGNCRGDFARILAQRLGHHHRRVGRKVPMGGIARRLDHDAAQQFAIVGQLGKTRDQRIGDAPFKKGKHIHERKPMIEI